MEVVNTTSLVFVLQFPGRLGSPGRQGIPTHGAGHPKDPRQDHRHRGGSLLLQKPQLQVRMRWRVSPADGDAPVFVGQGGVTARVRGVGGRGLLMHHT